MIALRYADNCAPSYMTEYSAGADLRAREAVTILAGKRGIIPTGVWIQDVDWAKIPAGHIPELQVRARSGLAYKKGITLANGVGTIDADYRDEICALVLNTSEVDVTIAAGERVAQLVMNMTLRIPGLAIGGQRTGGIGSTGTK